MEPIEFDEQTNVLAKDQEYLNLPVHHNKEDVVVTSCWRMGFWERVTLMVTGKLFLQVMTFGQPLQPQKPVTRNPVKI